MTVAENIALGCEGPLAGVNPARQLFTRRGDATAVRDAVAYAAAFTGVKDLMDHRVSAISTGQRRLVEFARVIAGPYDLALLDEPSSGLDGTETAHFGELLLRAREDRGLTVLIVEHDMSLVRQICDEVYVLDFGQLIFHGTPTEMLTSGVVRDAYLGNESADVEFEPVAPFEMR
jgi:ABC-type branched-subunit amino acid transport system ATPase component